MSWLRILLRIAQIAFIFCLFPCFLGLILFGPKGVLISFVLVAVSLMIFSCFAEVGILKAYQAHLSPPKGLARSLDLVAFGKEKRMPKFSVFSDPSPHIWVVRSLGGSGRVILSQGLVSLLNEEELRAMIAWSMFRLNERGIVFQSFCSVMAVWLLNLAPRPWVNLVFAGRVLSKSDEKSLHPNTFIGFLILFPLARFLLLLGKPTTMHPLPDVNSSTYSAVLQKISRAVSIWGPSHGGAELGFNSNILSR
jgi:heat shock protein HtpX